jgi:hypothetical protein
VRRAPSRDSTGYDPVEDNDFKQGNHQPFVAAFDQLRAMINRSGLFPYIRLEW